MVKDMQQLFNNLQTFFKLAFIAAIPLGAKVGKYSHHLSFVNEEFETREIKCILTAKMSFETVD